MKTIVVTGGIGSGKTEVCSLLEKKGIPVFDSDSMVKKIYDVRPDLKARAVPGIFLDGKKLAELESDVYPSLLERFESWAAAQDSEYVAFESAVILQKPFFDSFGDVVLLVWADESTRLGRALLRGNVPETSIKARMALQRDERNNPRVDFIVDNTSSIDVLETNVNKFLEKINYGKREN